ncbi:HD domain-containing protein [Candidatus Sneabacter namystus]|uniref:Bifunctional (P)ppGpp synthetase/guanosine-3',5'-bis(Diphosphate) 3'-pyrophosphohydrolase n=1 Tax=Candidatus Sneabacter namystus TaxID=2601646 RepID=A0A5C0UHZ5_9RICK|nr:HD domain-containing protein [Candidatus Sneabacter namystus]QEK39387.1 bifunctional (p)ppGpp synthetase/guanosine-3',5'-bis(diphosphate) 3'-pyrophosphohydrolase [Candidatus Sneabacter namystus]
MTKLEKLNQESSSKVDLEKIERAIEFAKKYHDGQFRKNGEPFYSHPLEVAYLISDYCFKTCVIAASILHDVVEDTEATIGNILDHFGWRIATLVDGVTRYVGGEKVSIEYIVNRACEKDDFEILLIKLFDRLHNVRTANFLSREKRKAMLQETLEQVLAIALFFGAYSVESELGRLCKMGINGNKSAEEKVMSLLGDEESDLSEIFSPPNKLL